jgi:hypothetical protein
MIEKKSKICGDVNTEYCEYFCPKRDVCEKNDGEQSKDENPIPRED